MRRRTLFTRAILLAVPPALWAATALASPADVSMAGPAPVTIGVPVAATHDRDDLVSPSGEASQRIVLAVPPGRNGAQPSVELVYGSRSPLRGGVAAGWTLPVSSIAVDATRGLLAAPAYAVDGKPLVRVDEPNMPAGVTAYRAYDDTTYTRYERWDDGSGACHWIARGNDGSVREYGNTTRSTFGGKGRWFIARSTDARGNEIIYDYLQVLGQPYAGAVQQVVDLALSSIEYGSNANAKTTTSSFARIDFVYQSYLDLCNSSYVPIGAQFTYREGTRRFEGARKLTAIKASVRNAPGAAWTIRREIDLGYDGTAMSCAAPHAPLRMLTSAQEKAWDATGTLVTKPAVHYAYGPLDYQFESVDQNPATYPFGSGAQLGGNGGAGMPYTWRTNADLDGDGRLDPIDWQQPTATGCGTLPIIPWANGQTPNTNDIFEYIEGCSASFQWTHRSNVTQPQPGVGWPVDFNHYRYLDFTGDGLPDLVTAITFEQGDYRPKDDSALDGDAHAQTYPSTCDGLPPPPCVDANGNHVACLFDASQMVPPLSLTLGQSLVSYKDSGGSSQCPSGGCPDPNGDGCNTAYCHDKEPTADDTGMAPTGGPTLPLIGDPQYNKPSIAVTFFPALTRVPDMHCGHYVLRLYQNLGGGRFATTPTIVRSPVPLESMSYTGRFDQGHLSDASPFHAFVDMDGDGQLDAVWQTPPDADNLGESHTGGSFFVWRGDGAGHFQPAPGGSPYVWPAPAVGNRAEIEQLDSRYYSLDGQPVKTGYSTSTQYPNVMTNTMQLLTDVNGDGLPDLLVSYKPALMSYQLQVYYNTGSGFETTPVVLEVGPDQLDIQTPSRTVEASWNRWSNGRNAQGYVVSARRSVDIDGDGLVDIAAMAMPGPNELPFGADRSVQVMVNLGDHLSPISLASDVAALWYPSLRNVVEYDQGQWQGATSVVDEDGDGLPEVQQPIESNCPTSEGSFSLCGAGSTVWRAKRLPYRLLTSVDNGFGAVTTYTYASVRDPAVVTVDSDHRIKDPLWVVSSAQTTGTNVPSATTTYAYRRPVTNADAFGRTAFRGFEEVQIVSPPSSTGESRTTIARRAYDQDPLGEDSETLTLDGAGRIATIEQKDWISTWTMQSAYAPAPGEMPKGARAFENTEVRRYTCSPRDGDLDASRTACIAEGKLARDVTTFTAVNTDKTSVSASGLQLYDSNPVFAYVPTTRRRTGALGGVHTGDRNTSTVYAVRYAAGSMLLLPTDKRTVQATAEGTLSGAPTLEHEATTYDATRDLPIGTARDVKPGVVATTRRVFDEIGNLTQETRPNQSYLEYPRSRTYAYDAFRAYASAETDELAHRVEKDHDYASGAVTEQRGPVQGSLMPYERTKYDGFGRVVQRSHGTPKSGALVDLVTYTASYSDSSSSRFAHESTLLDPTAGTWKVTYTFFDAIGRTLEEERLATMAEITRYRYDAAGNLVETTTPNPTGTAPATVSTIVDHDALGRVVREAAPAHAVRVTSYAGLVSTTSDQPTDGSVAWAKTVEHDPFGRLVRVTEGASTQATTLYSYDALDRMVGVVDADGVVTALAYFVGGQRQSVVRGNATTRFDYDRDGNRIAVYQPTPTGVDDSRYVSTFSYDAIDRPVAEVPASRELTAAQNASFSVGATSYRYDETTRAFGNGRVTTVTLPFGSIVYDYTVEGWTAQETRNFTVSPAGVAIAASGAQTMTYDARGAVASINYADDSTSPTRARWSYDALGRPDHVDLSSDGVSWRTVAKLTRNGAGLVVARWPTATASGTPDQSWYYDQAGRIASHGITGSLVAGGASTTLGGESLGYDDGGNVRTVTDRATGHTLTAKYDDMRRLISAGVPTTNDYVASFGYSPAGRLAKATVDSALANAQLIRRDVTYDYTPNGSGDRADPAAPRALLAADGSTEALMTYDASGNLLSRDGAAGSSFVHDGADRVRQATSAKGDREIYYYDHRGDRVLVWRSLASTGIVHRFGTAEIALGGKMRTTTVDVPLGASPVARVSNRDVANAQLLFHGALGSLLVAESASHVMTARYGYGVFGEVLYAEGTSGGLLDRTYEGKARDALTGLSYFGVRYYDPVTLGWTQADPLYRMAPDLAYDEPLRMAPYTFVLDNPLRYVDPDGRDSVGIDQCSRKHRDHWDVAQAKKDAAAQKRRDDERKKMTRDQIQSKIVALIDLRNSCTTCTADEKKAIDERIQQLAIEAGPAPGSRTATMSDMTDQALVRALAATAERVKIDIEANGARDETVGKFEDLGGAIVDIMNAKSGRDEPVAGQGNPLTLQGTVDGLEGEWATDEDPYVLVWEANMAHDENGSPIGPFYNGDGD